MVYRSIYKPHKGFLENLLVKGGTIDMKKAFTKVLAATLGMLFCLVVTVNADSSDSPWPTQYGGGSPRPTAIPALREWTAGSGSFQIGSQPWIIISPDDVHCLSEDAQIFANDLQAVTGHAGRVKITNAAPGLGDVLLELGSTDDSIGNEGYELLIGSSVYIKARTSAGVFYGTRTLLQLLKQNSLVPAGVARDWPRYSERGLMMDTARHFYSYNWLEDRIREMAYLKLNYLRLHLTDDQGWRIESKQGLQSPQFYTKEQIQRLVALAARYHITVVPEIEMPGHMGWALKSYPMFRLKDNNGVANPDKIDYSIPAAREFLKSLVKEYLPLFCGQYWHMGADEFLSNNDYQKYPQLEQYAKESCGPNATARDGFDALINQINALVRADGKTLRIWSDSLSPETTVKVDKNVIIDWWTDLNGSDLSPAELPQQILDEGYSIQNCSFWPTYDYNPIDYPPPPTIEGMYETWAVQRFHGLMPTFYDIDPAEPRNLGSELNYWNDGDDTGNLTEEQCAANIFPRLRVMAQKTWESAPLVTTYTEFQPIIESVGSAPSKPSKPASCNTDEAGLQ